MAKKKNPRGGKKPAAGAGAPAEPAKGGSAGGKRRKRLRFFARLRAYFLAGVLVTAPLAVTITLALWVIEFVDNQVVHLIPQKYNPDTYLKDIVGIGIGLPGLGLIVLIIVITLIGALTAGFLGRMVLRSYENLLNRMPVVRSVYGATKQVLETVLRQQSKAFRQPVLVEYPRRGIWAVGFVTGTTGGEVQHLVADRLINIFLPTTPNPTSGFLLFVPSEDLIQLDMSVEEAIKMVISAGIITPPDRRPEPVQATPVTAAHGELAPPPVNRSEE